MKPEHIDIVESLKACAPLVGMVARKTDDRSAAKIKAFIERSMAGIFVSIVWVVSSYNIDQAERQAQKDIIRAQSIEIRDSYSEIKRLMDGQLMMMSNFDKKFSDKHDTLGARVSNLEVSVGILGARK